MTTSPSEQHQTQAKGLSHRDYTPTPCPGPGPWARDVVSLLGAPIPLLQVMCGRHLKGEQERKVGGRRRGQILFPPCLSQRFANTRALQCPQEEGKHPPARAQGWMCVGAGFASPRHTTPVMSCSPSTFLLLSPAGHPPEPPHGAPHPARATLLPRWLSPCRDNRVESCRSFVSSLLAASARHTWEKTDTVRTHTLTKPTPNLDQYQRELITGSCIFR